MLKLRRIVFPFVDLEEDFLRTSLICLDLVKKRILYFGTAPDDDEEGTLEDYQWVRCRFLATANMTR